jgi:sulfur relay protein TusB/DsrH
MEDGPMSKKRVLLMLNQPPSKCPLDRQLRMLEGTEDKGALLIQDAVFHTVSEDGRRLLDHGFQLYALRQSVEARGIIDRIIDGVQLVDYHRVVDLIMDEYDVVV